MATPPAPETQPAPQAPPGRVGWRRRLTLGLAGAVGLVAVSHAAGIPFLYAAAGAGGAGAVYHGARHYPDWVRHWNPLGRPRDKDYRNRPGSKDFSEKWKSNWRRSSGPKLPAMFRSRPGSPLSTRRTGGSRHRRGAGLTRRGSGRAGHPVRFPGLRRRSRSASPPVRGRGTGLRRRPGASGRSRGSRRASRSSPGVSRGSRGTSRRFRPGSGRNRGTSGRPGGASRRSGLFRRGRAGGPRTPHGRRSPFRRRRTGTGSRPGSRPGTGSRPRGRSPGSPRRRLTRPWTWFRRRPKPGPGPSGRRRTRLARPLPKSRTWFAPWRGRHGPLARAGARWARWRKAAPARRQARLAHRARVRAWKAKLNRVAPRRRWRPWWRQSPVWRHRARQPGWWRRLARRWRQRRVLRRHRSWRRFLRRRPPQPQAPRGNRWQPQLARFDAWRRARWTRRMLSRVFRRRRQPALPVPLPQPRKSGPPPGRPERIPLPQQATSGNGNSPRGGHTMSSQVQNAAEALEDARGWEPSDESDVHDTIRAVPRIPAAARELLDRVASQLEEHPNIAPATSEAIHEAASQMGSISDQLEQQLNAGVMPG